MTVPPTITALFEIYVALSWPERLKVLASVISLLTDDELDELADMVDAITLAQQLPPERGH